MKKSIILVFVGLLLGAGTAWSFQHATKRSHYKEELYGYSLDAPRFPMVDQGKSGLTTIFTAPSVDGFSSNVTVVIQGNRTTRDSYRKTSRAEYKTIGAKIISERDLTVSGRDAYEVELEANRQGRDLHFLTLAVIDRERVVLITCTATVGEFPKHEAELRACLGSFRFEGEAR
jgi:hypothetical protein